jgi:hypothetical protein
MLAARRMWTLLLAVVLIVGTVTTAARVGSAAHFLDASLSQAMLDDCPDGATGAPTMALCAKMFCVTLLALPPLGAVLISGALRSIVAGFDQAGDGLSLAPDPGPPRPAILQ